MSKKLPGIPHPPRNGTSLGEKLCLLNFSTFASLWRDIKVVNDHAFIVSEASEHGMQVSI